MKTRRPSSPPAAVVVMGFTLAEMLTSMAVFSLLVVCIVTSHLMGMKMFNIAATKLSASHGARAALNRVRDEIRQGKRLDVGVRTGTNFDSLATGGLQKGNALKIFPTSDTNNFTVYWLDPTVGKLKRAASNRVDVIANYITNTMVFSAEDYLGNVLTNDLNCRVIKMTLEFYQWEFPTASASSGGYYDYYRLQTRISRRSIE